MALSAMVTAAFGSASQFLINLTNHDARGATSINATRLTEACDAAEGDFPVHAQVVYDETIRAHVNAGIKGAIAYLKWWSSAQGKTPGEMDEFHQDLVGIGKISARARITASADYRPKTDGDENLFHGITPEWPQYEEGP